MLGILGFLAALGGVALVKRLSNSNVLLLRSSLVQPSAVAELAGKLNIGDEDAFIYNSWLYVATEVKYSGYSSIVSFINNLVSCQRCILPGATLSHSSGNCVAKAALLASLLRNFIPASRVYLVMGELDKNGVGGHAWVEIERNGSWYILESTRVPDLTNLWVRVPQREYIPSVYFNDADSGLVCLDSKLCVAIKASRCPCEFDKEL